MIEPFRSSTAVSAFSRERVKHERLGKSRPFPGDRERGRTTAETPNALVSEIADALARAGEYAARVDTLPTQRLVDFKWAAHQAGRRLGMRIRIDVQFAKVDSEGLVPIRVMPQQTPD